MDNNQKNIKNKKTGIYAGLALVAFSIILFSLRSFFEIDTWILTVLFIIIPSFILGLIVFFASLFLRISLKHKHLDKDQRRAKSKSNIYILLTILFSLIIIIFAARFTQEQTRRHREIQEASSERLQESAIRNVERFYNYSQ